AGSLGENDEGWIVGKGSGSGWHLRIDSNGLYAQIECVTTDAYAASGSGEFSADGAWHHVAMTWIDAGGSGYPRLWIDGTESTYHSTQTQNGNVVSDAASSLIIGNRTDDARTWDGSIAWVRVSDSIRYSTTFTPPEIGALPEVDTDTVEQWALNDGTGTVAIATNYPGTNDGTITLGSGAWTEIDTTHSYDVSATVDYLPETYTNVANTSVTKSGYITIVPEQTAPKTLAQLVADVATLTARVEEVEKHLGCMPDAEWTQHATYTNVYSAALSRNWADGYKVIVKEDGVTLTEQTSIANVNSNAGSFYTTFATPTLTVYVHTTNTDKPDENDSNYSLRFLTYNIAIHEPVDVGEVVDVDLLSIDITESVTVGESVGVSVS
ncbi:LamG-like jellyroll fold domain-containing protein, partial [Kaarinaea lacus]